MSTLHQELVCWWKLSWLVTPSHLKLATIASFDGRCDGVEGQCSRGTIWSVPIVVRHQFSMKRNLCNIVALLKSSPICILAGAFYEIKTKKNMEAVEKSLMRNNIQAGSFSGWCQLKNSTNNCTLFSTHRMYLVILPRHHTFDRKLRKSEFS